MNKIFIWILIFFTFTLGAKEKLKRLNPHGDGSHLLTFAEIKSENNCMICHQANENGKVKVWADLAARCVSCHNDKPHSGLTEHLGKKDRVSKQEITCLSCHRGHKTAITEQEKKVDSMAEINVDRQEFLTHEKTFEKDQTQFTIKRRGSFMGKRYCTDCHFKDLNK